MSESGLYDGIEVRVNSIILTYHEPESAGDAEDLLTI